MFDVIKELLISEEEFTETNNERLKKSLVYIENTLIDSDGALYTTVYSFIEINNVITSSNNITLRKLNVNPYGFAKPYMDKQLTEDKPYQIIDQFNEIKFTSAKFYSILLNKIHPFYDGNARRCSILFANDDIIRQNIQTKLSYI